MNGNPINVLPHDTELEDSTVSVGFPSKVRAGICGAFDFAMRSHSATLAKSAGPQFVSLATSRIVCALFLKRVFLSSKFVMRISYLSVPDSLSGGYECWKL